MIKKINPVLLFICIIGLHSACSSSEEQTEFGSDEITSLPMQQMPLENTDNFNNTGENWSVAEGVQSNYELEGSMNVSDGTGTLVNIPAGENPQNILTDLEHGDLELELEFLVPRGSNSGIYLQGRYEVQVLDSWKVDAPLFSDVGGIYERWDDSKPEGERGYEGVPPKVNAGIAPGLWQELHILFRAPRFDDAGNKTENARFEKVFLNGMLIHENVEVTGPTRAAAFYSESTRGPIMLQGDHGPVAYRNIRYKTFNRSDSLTIGPINYKVYDYEGERTPVNLENLELLAEGVTDSFDVLKNSPKSENFVTRFTAEISVPTTGDYLFQTVMNNGGNLYINDELILENTGEYDSRRPGAIIHLQKGTHTLELTHLQVKWGADAIVFYEGPDMEKRTLASEAPGSGGDDQPPVAVQPAGSQPEIIGGFTDYDGKKHTHTVSVGDPAGIHYSYDLNNAALLKFWRDPFADVSRMWRGRGHEQLLVPMNAAIEETSGFALASLKTGELFSEQSLLHESGVSRYELNKAGQPVFHSEMDNITLQDHIAPSENNTDFIRTLQYTSDQQFDEKVARIASGNSIDHINNSLYRIDGRYYLDLIEDGGNAPEIAEHETRETLIIPILNETNQSTIRYRIIW